MPSREREVLRTSFLSHTSQLGGAELSLRRYLAWPSRQLDASLILLQPGGIDPWGLPPDVDATQPDEELGLRNLRNTLRFLRDALDMQQPDLVVCNSLTVARYLALVPKQDRFYIQHLRQEAVPQGTPLLSKIFSYTFGLARFDAFIANSQWTASTLPTWIRQFRPIEVAHPVSGISREHAESGPNRSQEEGLRLLTLSRLSPWKGLHVALDAVRICKERSPGSISHLTVAGGNLFGEDSYADSIKAFAHTHNLPVRFVGHVSDVNGLLAEHDVLLSPSLTPEPFGQVIVQGMHAGLAVIATTGGGPSEVIRDGDSGLLIPPSSSDDLAQAVLRLASQPGLLMRMRRRGQLEAASYVDEATLPAFERTLVSLAAGRA
jgi:glycosyltransferase involved in cell wall biosynthesis